jgi:hypothetical protein
MAYQGRRSEPSLSAGVFHVDDADTLRWGRGRRLAVDGFDVTVEPGERCAAPTDLIVLASAR